MWRKKKKRNYYLLFFPFISFYFCYFFSFQSHWKLFLYVSSDFFEVYSLVHFYKKKSKKKNLYWTKLPEFLIDFFISPSCWITVLKFFPHTEFKVLCSNLQQKRFFFFYLKWDETPWVYGKSIVGAYITRITYILKKEGILRKHVQMQGLRIDSW